MVWLHSSVPDRVATVHQHLADARPHAREDDLQVESRRLDDICGPDVGVVTLMKVDVEGHEVAALEGAERILSNGVVQLIVEFNTEGLMAAGTSSEQLWELLTRTHQCCAVVAQDGVALPPVEASIASQGPDLVLNTIWVPRSTASCSRGASF